LKKILPKDLPLSKYEFALSPVNGTTDEGLIEKIFQVIEPKSGFCIEFGAGNGEDFLGVRYLIKKHNFSALLIEANTELAKLLHNNYRDNPKVTTVESFISKENIEEIFSINDVPAEPDLMIIDIDGNDYHIWESIEHYHPQVVCIEYNASYRPEEDFVADYDPDLVWKGDDYHSASIKQMVALASSKEYSLIHCKKAGDNLYFVKNELYHLLNIKDNSPEVMYQLPQMGKFGRAINGKGHPASKRNTSRSQRFYYIIRYYLMSLPRKIVKKKIRLEEERNRSAYFKG